MAKNQKRTMHWFCKKLEKLKYDISLKKIIYVNFRPIIVKFSFIVISCTWSLIRHVVIIWLFGKILKILFSLPCLFSCLFFLHVFCSYIDRLWSNIIIFLNFNLSIQIIFFLKKEIILFESVYFSYFKTYFFSELNKKTRNL